MFAYRPLDGSPGYIPGEQFYTSYHAMSSVEMNKKSDFPPGYGGYQQDVKFKYGYGNLGPDTNLTALRPTSTESGVQYDPRPKPTHPVLLPKVRSFPGWRTPAVQAAGASKLSPGSRKFYRTAREPFYLNKKDLAPFPYYRPLSGKNGSVSPGGQYPSHPMPPFRCPQPETAYKYKQQDMKAGDATRRPPLTSTLSSTWGSCCAGYRPNAASLGRVSWMPLHHDPENFMTTYRRDLN
eukprot:GEMP01052867.1.p1 GENE.GEMP01052867.1~~GEMP01052867.1.p1  ORF type:complete len:247 (+),score=41.32 GEMP01052867.1:31-741(+)